MCLLFTCWLHPMSNSGNIFWCMLAVHVMWKMLLSNLQTFLDLLLSCSQHLNYALCFHLWKFANVSHQVPWTSASAINLAYSLPAAGCIVFGVMLRIALWSHWLSHVCNVSCMFQEPWRSDVVIVAIASENLVHATGLTELTLLRLKVCMEKFSWCGHFDL